MGDVQSLEFRLKDTDNALRLVLGHLDLRVKMVREHLELVPKETADTE